MPALLIFMGALAYISNLKDAPSAGIINNTIPRRQEAPREEESD
jgi:hypothetical protein